MNAEKITDQDPDRKLIDVKMWLTIGMFGISLIGAISSYFKSTGDIRVDLKAQKEDMQTMVFQAIEKIRTEVRETYATKESAQFQNETLQEIKADVKEIKGRLGRK